MPHDDTHVYRDCLEHEVVLVKHLDLLTLEDTFLVGRSKGKTSEPQVRAQVEFWPC